MFTDFIASWSLFSDAYLASWLLAGLLALVGVAVVVRGQVFLGAALAQASTCGVAIGLWLAGSVAWLAWLDQPIAHTLLPVVSAMLAALVANAGRVHREAVTAWIFLASAAGAVLVVAKSPHGMEEVQRLLASSIVGATGLDVAMILALILLTIAVLAFAGDRVKAVVMDASFASAVGLRVHTWEVVLALWLGLVIGSGLHVAGLLYTFGCLVLPAIAARSLARELATLAWLAPLLALLSAVAGAVIGNAADLPLAQVTVGVLALGAVAAGLWGRWQ